MTHKIGIITHYDVHNHGAILQLNGLVQFLRKRGFEARGLQFDKNYDFLGVELKSKYNISIKSIPFYISYLIKKGIKRTSFNYFKKRLLDSFKASNNLIGEYYTATKGLDTIIIGSDEVFALHTGPTPIFYGHGSPAHKTISYAASFGPTTIEDINRLNCKAFVASGIDGLDAISVRDNNSKTIVEELVGKESQIVLDPVLLYGYIDELSVMKRPMSQKYMVVYAYDEHMNDPKEVLAIKRYAKDNNLIIVSPGFYHSWADRNVNVSPLGLLNYVKFAECVVTDTFHGSVTSLICNTQFASILRGNTNKLQFLLSEYDLTSRIVKSIENLSQIFDSTIDYSIVNKTISSKRIKSEEFLLKNLK